MKVLVTGATGFIGSWVAHKLVEKGDTVRALARRTSNLSFLKTLPVDVVYGDFDDRGSLAAAVKGVEAVYHCGAKVLQWGSWKDFYRANVEGTRTILEASLQEGAGGFIYLSTVGIFGIKDLDRANESQPLSVSGNFYTDAKLEAELLVRKWMNEKKIPLTIVYPTLTYGPRDGNLTLRAVKVLKRGMIPDVGGGRSRASFSYVENLADAVVSAGTIKSAAGRSYIVTDGEPIPWARFLSLLAEGMGLKVRVIHVPYYPVYPFLYGIDLLGKVLLPWKKLQSLRSGLRFFAARRSFDTTHARTELGWVPRVSLQEGIGRTVRWLRENGHMR